MALIPPFFLDCVVAIGFPETAGSKKWNASGFLYGKLVEDESAEEKTYELFLVTNRHAFEGYEKAFIRFNPKADEAARDYELMLVESGELKWHAHPDLDVDVAVISINARFLRKNDIQFNYFRSDEHLADRERASELGLTEGDTIFVLGFPMGLVGKERSFVIVRTGCIARIRDALLGSSRELLIDAPVFPGNSGGPVVTKPEGGYSRDTGSQQSISDWHGHILPPLSRRCCELSDRNAADCFRGEFRFGICPAHGLYSGNDPDTFDTSQVKKG